jgi:hypothetical protein
MQIGAQRGGAVQERWGMQSRQEAPLDLSQGHRTEGAPPTQTVSPTSPAQPLPFVHEQAGVQREGRGACPCLNRSRAQRGVLHPLSCSSEQG